MHRHTHTPHTQTEVRLMILSMSAGLLSSAYSEACLQGDFSTKNIEGLVVEKLKLFVVQVAINTPEFRKHKAAWFGCWLFSSALHCIVGVVGSCFVLFPNIGVL